MDVGVGLLLVADSYKTRALGQSVYNFVKSGQLFKRLKLGTRRHMQRCYSDITSLLRCIMKQSRLEF